MTAIRDLFHIDLPIIQAPMGGAQGSAMAVAVSDVGGLGSLPCAMLTPEGVRKELLAYRAHTRRPVNVNFFAHRAPVPDAAHEARWRDVLSPYFREFGIDPATIPAGPGRVPFGAEAADVLEDLRPEVVSFHFGLPEEGLFLRAKACGAKILASATTVDEALWLEAHGVDAIIAQGVEAGGHRGIFLTDDLSTQIGTFALVPQVVRAVKVPVIAAGGIADAEGVRAALALGASAVQAGTAYLLCPEAFTTPIHRAALKSDATRHTALTNLFTGRPARGIVNRIMRELGPMSGAPPMFPLATAAITAIRAKAEAQGSGEFSPLWSGQNASGCREVSAAEITRGLAAGL